MKLATFTHNGSTRIGIVDDAAIIDIAVLLPGLPRTLRGLLEQGESALAQLRDIQQSLQGRIPLDDVKLAAPIPNPRKFLGIGGNTYSHVEEVKEAGIPVKLSHNQTWFNKQVTCINGPYNPIHLPRVSRELDYEGEMAIVIGKRCRNVPKEKAYEVIAGYTVANDVSVRDWQLRSPTATLGKSFDTHGPTGPWLVTRDEIDDPHNLTLRTWVNGELRMDGKTDEFLHQCDEMIAELSSVFTLEPGDILATGSPRGVGALMNPPAFLKTGDVVRVEVSGIGVIENTVIDEPPGYQYVPLIGEVE